MTNEAIEARRAYKRKWARENPDKVKAQQERYWAKRRQRLKKQTRPKKEAAI